MVHVVALSTKRQNTRESIFNILVLKKKNSLREKSTYYNFVLMSVRHRKNLQNEESSSDPDDSATKRLTPKVPGGGGKDDNDAAKM